MPISQRLYIALLASLLACVTYLVYQPGLHGPFVFDDLTNILLVKTTYLRELSFSRLYQTAMAVHSGPLHRPIAILSFALNYYFTGVDVYYFKLTNLTIHLITGMLIYGLSYRLLRRPTQDNPNDDYSALKLHLLGLSVAAIWLLHPLNLTSVLYVVQRMTSLASLFTVLGVLVYVIGRDQVLRGQRRGFATMVASLLVFGPLAALSKEIGILLPVYILLVEVFIYRMAAPEGLQKSFRWTFYTIVAAPLVLGLCIALVKSGSLLAVDAYSTRNFTLTERLLTESRVLWFYLKLIVAPTLGELGTYHDDIALSSGLLVPITTLFSVIGITVLLVLAFISRRRAPLLGFGIAWFLTGHSLESTIVPLEIAHEHRNYLPQFGILFSAIYYVSHASKTHLRTQYIRYLAIACLTLLMGVITHARAKEWKDEWTLFNTEARNHPDSARSQTALAVLYHDNKKYLESGEHFRRAVDLEPSNIETVIRLAQYDLRQQGRIAESTFKELEYRAEHYNSTTVAINLITDLTIYVRKDKAALARVLNVFETINRKYEGKLTKPWQLSVYHTLSTNYDALGQHDMAIVYFMRSAALDPRPYFYLQSAIQYAKLGNREMVDRMIITMADKKLRLDKNDQDLLAELQDILKHPKR
jgi:protein O-mannosyl-transferase